MDFTLPEDVEALRDLAGRILGDLSTTDRLAAVDGWYDEPAWQELARAGVLAAPLPEDVGGGGLGFLVVHVLLERVGATAAQVPLWEALVLGALPLATFGDDRQRAVAAAVAEGSTLVTGALSEEGGDPWDPGTAARRAGDRWELDGTKTAVPLGTLATALLVSARDEDGHTGIWVVDPSAPGVTVTAQLLGDGQPNAVVGLTAAPAVRLGNDAVDVLGWVLDRALAGIASQQAGVCAAALRMAADHAGRREQFGRPIATFQAVGQRLADAWIDAHGVALTALHAAWRLGEGLVARDEATIAKWWAAEAGHRVLHTAGHVHGGIGVDRTYGLPRWFQMGKRLEFALGSASPQLLRLGTAMALEPA